MIDVHECSLHQQVKGEKSSKAKTNARGRLSCVVFSFVLLLRSGASANRSVLSFRAFPLLPFFIPGRLAFRIPYW